MRDRTVNRVESWDARPFSGGFATLRDMSDANFSGVVVSGDAWLFMLNGRIVGIVDGDIDDFEDASGTMYEAPDPSLPLLFSMQERAGTTQAKYYTNDTPLEEADKTLSDANFTGYVELSENVLSGDYYLVYYGGRALPVAFVGTTNELKTGDEAYELAADEVGVYEVIKTPVNVTQVPGGRSQESDTDETAAAGAGAGTGAAAGTGAGAAEDATAEAGGEAEEAVGSSAEPDAVEDASSEPEPEPQPEPEPEPSAEATAAEDSASGTGDSVVEAAEPDESGPTEAAQTGAASTESTRTEPSTQAASSATESTTSSSPSSETPAETPADAGSSGAGEAADTASRGDDSSVFSEEEQWRQTKSIPSLSPSEREKRRNQQMGDAASPEQQTKRPRSERPEGATESAQPSKSGTDSGFEASQSVASSEPRQPAHSRQSTTEESTDSDTSTETSGVPDSSAEPSTDQQTGTPVETSAAAKQRIKELKSQLEQVDAERGELEDDLDSTRSERDELRKRVRQLENALEEAGGKATAGPTLTPDEALAGTNLFVRYGSRGAPTLDDLTGKQPDAEAINKNLRIDHHTQFESKEAAVDGTPFDQFLEGTSSFRFVSWLVRDLPYEVLDAGHRGSLGDLYEVIPEIDRAELQGVVEIEAEDGNERREFDIVLRDRMGNPLVVAELNDERDPVSGEEMASLIESAQVVGEGADDLGAAFYVTASFFEPDALENAAEATETGGILSRSDRASYVKLARKHGFHLCLAEDRNDTFHLTVPEL